MLGGGVKSASQAQAGSAATPSTFYPAVQTSLATRQLALNLSTLDAYLNGRRVVLNPQASVQEGRTLLPAVATAELLAAPYARTRGGLRLGRLEVAPKRRWAARDGRSTPFADIASVQDGTLFIGARAFADAVGATLALDTTQNLLTLTLGQARGEWVKPVARFALTQRAYRLGEPIGLLDYSYDPNGLGLSGVHFEGREEAYFQPGEKTITLTVTNSAGVSSTPYGVNFIVTPDVMDTPLSYALRFEAVGRTFTDPNVLSYPVIIPTSVTDTTTLIVSDSPEAPTTSGLLYAEQINGAARLTAHHLNTLNVPARLVILAGAPSAMPVTLRVTRLGETPTARVVATLGQNSLLDYLSSGPLQALQMQPHDVAPLYASPPLQPGQGLALTMDLFTSGPINLEAYWLEETLAPGKGDPFNVALMRSLPALTADGVHSRGTFSGANRVLDVDASNLPPGRAARIVLADGVIDLHLRGRDALTGSPAELKGNYGVAYSLTLRHAANLALALSPRGGLYAGAISVNGVLQAVPPGGVLVRPDAPLLLARLTGDVTNLEFMPAAGSFLPINLILYPLPR